MISVYKKKHIYIWHQLVYLKFQCFQIDRIHFVIGYYTWQNEYDLSENIESNMCIELYRALEHDVWVCFIVSQPVVCRSPFHCESSCPCPVLILRVSHYVYRVVQSSRVWCMSLFHCVQTCNMWKPVSLWVEMFNPHSMCESVCVELSSPQSML